MQTVDFKIISNTTVPGLSLVYALNENAYHHLVDENIQVMDFGAAPIDSDDVGDFISDAGWSNLSAELV